MPGSVGGPAVGTATFAVGTIDAAGSWSSDQENGRREAHCLRVWWGP